MDTILVSGSKEFLLIPVKDRLGILLDLADANPSFWITTKDGTEMQAETAAGSTPTPDVNGFQMAKCLVDTSTSLPDVGVNWPSGEYELYLKLIGTPDEPIEGPFIFHVEEIGTV